MKLDLDFPQKTWEWLLDSLEADIERMSESNPNPDPESLKQAKRVYDALWKALSKH